jgi:hypothetical protein
MSLFAPLSAESRRKTVYGVSACALIVLVGFGVFAKNGWLPHTDALTGRKTGWFGKELPKNAGSTWNPLAAPSPTPTPQLSKEYIYAGQRLLAVEDANANAAPPADLAVWRPGVNSGTWWVLGGPGSQQVNYQYGTTGDVPSPGDYDGDGKTDFAVWRPGTQGQFFIHFSSDGTDLGPNYGTTGDKPIQADFDGDGKTDIAVYRSGTQSQWFIHRSSDGQDIAPQFGTTTDIPAPADYDGDGKADLAVWRPSTQTFWISRSSDSQVQQVTLGNANEDPVPGDYDGDGKADCALFDPTINTVTDTASPNWHILLSSTSQTSPTVQTHRWGTGTDTPVPNDYDGDGKVDLAVWRPGSQAWWYIINSHDGSIRSEAWGTTGDIPVPAYYRR